MVVTGGYDVGVLVGGTGVGVLIGNNGVWALTGSREPMASSTISSQSTTRVRRRLVDER